MHVRAMGGVRCPIVTPRFVIPSGARDLAREWLDLSRARSLAIARDDVLMIRDDVLMISITQKNVGVPCAKSH
jgi:hypothetical protein